MAYVTVIYSHDYKVKINNNEVKEFHIMFFANQNNDKL